MTIRGREVTVSIFGFGWWGYRRHRFFHRRRFFFDHDRDYFFGRYGDRY